MRKLSGILGMGLGLLPSLALAVGLGGVKVRSNLNQPLDAEVPILELGNISPAELKANLAPTQTFQKLGIDKPSYLGELKFTITKNANGQDVIQITSNKPITQPIVQFLIDLNWPDGRMYREYVIFLDPASYEQARRTKLSKAARTRTSAHLVKRTPSKTSSTGVAKTPSKFAVASSQSDAPPAMQKPSPSPSPKVSPAVQTENYGPTKSTESLWHIANKVRPNKQVTTQQVAIALYRRNPQAFTHHNVNGIKPGYELKVPTLSQINEISAIEAERILGQENTAWHTRDFIHQPSLTPFMDVKEGTKKHQVHVVPLESEKPQNIPQTQQAQAQTAQKTAQTMLPPAPPKHLQIPSVRKETTLLDTSVLPTGAQAQASSSIQAELALSSEALNEAKQNNQTLMSEIDSLRKEVSKLESQLTSKNEQVIALERLIAEQPKLLSQPGAAAGSRDTVIQTLEHKPADENNNHLWLILVLASVIGLLGAGIYWQRRRHAPIDMTIEDDEVDVFGNEEMPPEGVSDVVTETTKLNETGEKPSQASATKASGQSSLEDYIIEEANVLIAYGREEQAAKLLSNKLENMPDLIEIRLKLLELCAIMGDQNGFDTAREGMTDTSQETLEKVSKLAQTLEQTIEDKTASPTESTPRSTSKLADSEESILEELEPEPEPKPEPKPELEPEPELPEEIEFSSNEPVEFNVKSEPLEDSPVIEARGTILANDDDSDESDGDNDMQAGEDHTIEFSSTEPEPIPSVEVPEEQLEDRSENKPESKTDQDNNHNMTTTQMDLAKAYFDMGDYDEAKNILQDVLKNGDTQRHEEAERLLKKITDQE